MKAPQLNRKYKSKTSSNQSHQNISK